MFLFTVCLFVSACVNSVYLCPTQCTCDEVKREVECHNKNLTAADLISVVKNIPGNTTNLSFLGNRIVSFSYKLLFGLYALEELDLSSNLIQEIPHNLSIFSPSLKVLNLQNNKIYKLTQQDFVGLQSLTKLQLKGNKLTTISESLFSLMTNLEQVLLEENQISNIHPKALMGLKKLVRFAVTRNNLTSIEPGLFEFFDDMKPKTILFGYNSISEIPNGLFGIKQEISLLELSNNKISKIADKAFQNSNIKGSLLLNSNILKHIPLTAFYNMKFGALYLRNNPLVCDCNFYKFMMLKQTGRIFGNCASPLNLANKALTDIRKLKSEVCTICDFNSTCYDNAVCSPLNETAFECNCSENYEGKNCEIKKKLDICNATKPCRNNATCVNVNETTYSCHCSNEFEGVNCDVSKSNKACDNNPCLNNGQCILMNESSYKCQCKEKFEGKNCEKEKKVGTKNVVWIILGLCFGAVIILIVIIMVVRHKRKQHAELVTTRSDSYHSL